MVQAHERADGLSKDVQQLALADISAALPATVQVAVQSALAQSQEAPHGVPVDLAARLSRLEAACPTCAPAAAQPAARPQATAAPAAERPGTASMEPGRRAALQGLVQIAVDDLEGRLFERVQGHTAPLDEAIKRCGCPPGGSLTTSVLWTRPCSLQSVDDLESHGVWFMPTPPAALFPSTMWRRSWITVAGQSNALLWALTVYHEAMPSAHCPPRDLRCAHFVHGA